MQGTREYFSMLNSTERGSPVNRLCLIVLLVISYGTTASAQMQYQMRQKTQMESLTGKLCTPKTEIHILILQNTTPPEKGDVLKESVRCLSKDDNSVLSVICIPDRGGCTINQSPQTAKSFQKELRGREAILKEASRK